MIMSIVRHPIRAKYADEWPELAAPFTTASRAEPGNICFDWFRSVDDPNLYLLVEMFGALALGDAEVGRGRPEVLRGGRGDREDRLFPDGTDGGPRARHRGRGSRALATTDH